MEMESRIALMFISFDLETNYIIKYLETHNKMKNKAQN